MDRYSLSHLAKDSLRQNARAVAGQKRDRDALLIAHIAEIDRHGYYADFGYPSMRAYCMGDLHLSRDGAAKRIQVARKARELPVILHAIAEGRVHLSGMNLLAPYLRPENVEDLLEAATHRTDSEIERLVAERFPRPDAPEWMGEAGAGASTHAGRLASTAPGRVLFQCPISREEADRIQYALELMSHRNPQGRLAALVGPAVEALIRELEKEKFAATDRPSGLDTTCGAARVVKSRHIPADVKRAVWERDGGACTFVSDDGHVCGSRWMVEFDHVQEVGRGGEATVDNVRLLCRAHNQLCAERTYGPGFMEQKRREAAEARAAERKRRDDEARQRAEVRARADEESRAREAEASRAKALVAEVIPYLRKLRFTADEARERATAACEFLPHGTLEERVKSALSRSYARRPVPIEAA